MQRRIGCECSLTQMDGGGHNYCSYRWKMITERYDGQWNDWQPVKINFNLQVLTQHGRRHGVDTYWWFLAVYCSMNYVLFIEL